MGIERRERSFFLVGPLLGRIFSHWERSACCLGRGNVYMRGSMGKIPNFLHSIISYRLREEGEEGGGRVSLASVSARVNASIVTKEEKRKNFLASLLPGRGDPKLLSFLYCQTEKGGMNQGGRPGGDTEFEGEKRSAATQRKRPPLKEHMSACRLVQGKNP